MSVLSTGCIVWLGTMQPLFIVLAAVALAYQAVLVWRRPAQARTRRVMRVLWISVSVNVLVLVSWGLLAIRFR